MEQLVNTEKINALQAELIQYLTDCFPPVWWKLCFYAEVTPASVRIWLMQADLESDRLPMADEEKNEQFWEYMEDCPVNRSEAEQQLAARVSALHRAYLEQGKNWRLMLCAVWPNGSVRFDFEYRDVSVNQAVVNAAVRRQGCPEPVQPPGPLPDTEMIRTKQAALEQYLISIMPVPWKKICFFIHRDGARLTNSFAVQEAETGTVCTQDFFQRRYAGFYVPGRDEMKRKLNQLAASLHFYYTEACGKENTWRSMFLTVTPDGPSHTEFAWAPFSEQDDPYEIFFGGA